MSLNGYGSPVKRKATRYVVEVDTPDGLDQWYLGTSVFHSAYGESRARITTLRHVRLWLLEKGAKKAAAKWARDHNCTVKKVEVDPDWTWEKGAF